MAKVTKQIQPTVLHVKPKGSFLLKVGKLFYLRLQPVPYRYCKPDYVLLKRNL